MKFREEKAVVINGHKFEHARIVQGVLIYAVLIGIAIFGILAGEKSALLIPGAIALVYIFNLFVYTRKNNKLKNAAKPALFATLCMPTSMIG